MITTTLLVAAAPVCGAAAGALVRCALARLRRGVVVPRGWCEVAAAAAWSVVAALGAGGGVAGERVPVLAGLSLLAVAGTATDLLAGRLPDAVTVSASVLLALLLVPAGGGALAAGLLGAVVLGGCHLVVACAGPEYLGGGDVKLATALGVPLGATGWWALAAAPVAAAVLVLAAAGLTRRRRVPLGPPLLAAAWGAVLLGS